MAKIVEVKDVLLTDLTIGLGQARIHEVYKELDVLADSIQKVGLLEPIVVSPTDTDGQYEIITGQRRFLACQQLGLPSILAAVLDEQVDEITAKVLSVTENMVRKDLNQRDLIDVCTYLYNRYGTLNAVIEETGLPYQKVRNYVRYDRLVPPLKEMVDSGKVDVDVALRAQEAASVSGNVNVEEAVVFAEEMATMSGVQRKAIVKDRESNPSKPADEIIENAKTGARLIQLAVTLTSEVHGALGRYANSEGVTLADAGSRLIQTGLYVDDYLSEPA